MVRRYVLKNKSNRGFNVDYENDLNLEQQEVVMAGHGPALVVAGPGSGKTRTVTYRVARLVESGIPANRIMLVTFTNRAARQMLARVDALVAGGARKVWGGTFHSIAGRILRQHAEVLGYQPNFTILDSEDAIGAMEFAVSSSGIDTRQRRFPGPNLLTELISTANNRDLSIRDTIARYYPQFSGLEDKIETVSRAFQQTKLRRNTMDYDDLLINWRRLLVEQPDLAELWATHFIHVLVDEYQDTNRLQAEIVDLLGVVNKNVMVVGDDAQSIFGWRGAHFENIYTFRDRYPGVREFRLESNYRSRPEILLVANASIRRNQRQLDKTLRAMRESSGVKPALVPLANPDQQAWFVVSRVLELRDDGTPLSGMAVLYRSHWHSLELQIELTRRGVPYMVRSGVRFFEQAHIKDVISYLRVVVNPLDDLSLKRILKLIPGVGAKLADRIWSDVLSSPEPLSRLLDPTLAIPARARTGWTNFVRLMRRLTDQDLAALPSSQIELVLESGYSEYLDHSYREAELRREDLRQLANYARGAESTHQFLVDLALIAGERFSAPEGVVGEDVIQSAEDDEKLVLSSIHQAKGLEWRVVFLIWAAEGKFPTSRSLRDPEVEEEERRLFYVAITRAMDEVYISFPVMVSDSIIREVVQRPSRFVTEVPVELFEVWSVEEENPDPSIQPSSGFIN